MCTMIAEKTPIAGSSKGPGGWFRLGHAYIGYDHPVHAPYDHAILLDFVDEAAGPSARTAVELDPASARELAQQILKTVGHAEDYENSAADHRPDPDPDTNE